MSLFNRELAESILYFIHSQASRFQIEGNKITASEVYFKVSKYNIISNCRFLKNMNQILFHCEK